MFAISQKEAVKLPGAQSAGLRCQRLFEDSQLRENRLQPPFAERPVFIRPRQLDIQSAFESYLHQHLECLFEVDLPFTDGNVAVENQIVVAHMGADDPVRKGVDEGSGTAGKEARMGDIQREAEVLRWYRIENT